MRRLIPNPASPPRVISAVFASIEANALRFVIEGAEALRVPEAAEPVRTDELWRTTCFELFVRARGQEAYREFNFSPSGAWAAYAFDGYRSGMRPLELAAAPVITRDVEGWNVLLGGAAMPAGEVSVGLTAVIEEIDGTKSYWALAHPAGPPDFHDPACFALDLAAPSGP